MNDDALRTPNERSANDSRLCDFVIENYLGTPLSDDYFFHCTRRRSFRQAADAIGVDAYICKSNLVPELSLTLARLCE